MLGVKRPDVVTALGWIYIVLAALMLLAAIGGFVVRTVIDQRMPEGRPPVPDDAPLELRFDSIVFGHYRILCVAQTLFAVLLGLSAAQFLRLRAWARHGLEAATWLGLTCVVGVGILTASDSELPGSLLVRVVMGTVFALVYAVPCLVLIWLLRGATTRHAMLTEREPPPIPPESVS